MKNFFLEGCFSVNSLNPRNIHIVDVKLGKWFDTMEEIYDVKRRIDEKINPSGLSYDEGIKQMIISGRNCDPRLFPSIRFDRL